MANKPAPPAPIHGIQTIRYTDDQQLNEALTDLLTQKRPFAVTYSDTEVILSYPAGPLTKPKE